MNPNQITQIIGQLESSVSKFEETEASDEDFQDYCDNLYSCVSYWRQKLRIARKNEKGQGES